MDIIGVISLMCTERVLYNAYIYLYDKLIPLYLYISRCSTTNNREIDDENLSFNERYVIEQQCLENCGQAIW